MTFKIIRLSLKAIYNNKMRSFLTMLGIIIGVMAVVILFSITQGATRGITDSIASMGSDQITATISDDDVAISAEDVEALTKYSSIFSVILRPPFRSARRRKRKAFSALPSRRSGRALLRLLCVPVPRVI